MFKFFLGILLSFAVSLGFAQEGVQPLPMDQAFVFTTYVDQENNITFQWNVAPGYFLYQNKFNFTLSPTSKVNIGKIFWPKGASRTDFEGKTYPIYSGLVKLTVPLLGTFRGPIVMTINYQGCSLSGFCYAPVSRYLHVDLSEIKPLQDLTKNVTARSTNQPFLTDQNTTQRIFAGHGVMFILFSFLGLGLLLAFTPCVLPMIPILSGIIVGHQKKISTLHAFSLSFAYVLGMAVTYAIAGMIVASLGSSIQTLFQKPWIIILFSGLFVLLSLSLFGFYELQLPARWQKHTTSLSNRLEGGTYFGVFLMGCLSTLIVSPCVSAPLVGVLAYIAQTGDMFLGGTALLMLGFGMGIPLLLIGTSAGKWLPKAGQWMDSIKKLFGFLMLSVAVWMLSRIVSGPVSLMLWSVLVVGAGLFLSLFCEASPRVKVILRMMGSLFLVYGIILIAGAALGNTDPLNPWAGGNNASANEMSLFKVVKNNNELILEMNAAKKNKKPVILDFYATWCVSCVMMDKTVFSQAAVRTALNDFVLLRIDMTENNLFDQSTMKRLHVVAPPEMVFFDEDGKVLESKQIVGEVSETELLNRINEIKGLLNRQR